MKDFPNVPEDLGALSDEELQAFIGEATEAVEAVAATPEEYVSDELTVEELFEATASLTDAIDEARGELAARQETEDGGDGDAGDGDEPAAEAADDAFARIRELASRVSETGDGDDDDDGDGDEPAGDEPAAEEAAAEVVTAAADPDPAPAPRKRLPKPTRSAASAPAETHGPPVSLTASASGLGYEPGAPLESGMQVAEMMIRRRKDFGRIAKGTKGEKIPIAQFDWSDSYGEDRILGESGVLNASRVEAVVDPAVIRQNFDARKAGSLTASGGLCAPVTPYYNLAMVSVAARPVRAALPSFNADRGGIRYARPATLASIDTAVGIRTAAQDEAGGTFATKTCQVVDCPDFQETDVAIIYHCLQFGNLGSRTFPERVVQWNNLTLAAHARLAESTLLTAIGNFSTAVTASALGLGASATLPSQILAAAAGMRSRHRMDENAVLRVMLPNWVKDLLVSDVYRTQFQRFDMTADDFIRILRAGNVEPSFYIDGAAGAAQVFGTQTAGVLLPFPATVVWYLFPEGSFLYLDGGTLELGIVRDSVLNETNDYQIFGESFEAVAYVGVDAIKVTTTVCDNGTVSLPNDVNCPIVY